MRRSSYGNSRIDALMTAMEEARRLDDEAVAAAIKSMERSVQELQQHNRMMVQAKTEPKR